jgi:hypothetical protein
MKKLMILFLMLFTMTSYALEKPAIWGKIYKTKKKVQGHSYFIYFKKDGKDYAYPLSTKSNIDPIVLDKLNGKFAKIYGKTSFESANLDKSKFILTFLVRDAKELKLSELSSNLSDYSKRDDLTSFIKINNYKTDKSQTRISDEVANSAIFLGGMALAAEVLSTLLAH